MDRWVRAYTVNNSALAGKMPRTLNTLGRAMMPAPMTAAKQATKVCQGAQERRRSHFPRRRLRRTRVAEVRHRQALASSGGGSSVGAALKSRCHQLSVAAGGSWTPSAVGASSEAEPASSGCSRSAIAPARAALRLCAFCCATSDTATNTPLASSLAPKPQDAMTLGCSGPHECCIASRSASWCRTGGPLCGGALAAAALDSRRQWTQQQQTVAVTRSGLLAVSRLRAPPGGS